MNRTKLWGLIIAAALLLGLGVWLLDRSNRSLGPDTSDPATGVAADTGSNPDRQRSRQASARPDLALAPKAAIAGTIRDPQANPIAGAQVCVWLSSSDLGGLPPGSPRCAKSEADGHYRLEGLMPVRVTVNAEARGFVPQPWFAQHQTHRDDRLQLVAGQTRERVDFVLRPGGVEVKGVVRDISGGVIEGAFVWSSGSGFETTGRSAALSDSEGRFTLWVERGPSTLAADADGYATNHLNTTVPGPTLEIVLTPESVITGRVVMAGTGEPVSGVAIEANPQGWFRGDADGSARSDDGGSFRITKLAPGIYAVGARGDELFGEASELVHLGLAETAEAIVIELHPAFMISGRITLAGGPVGRKPQPCPKGSVHLEDRNTADTIIHASTRADGEIELRSVLPGTYEVVVRCEGMIAAPEYPDVVITSASLTGLVWEVREGLAIRGVVVDAQGSPVAGIKVATSMAPDPDDPHKQRTYGHGAPSRADGSFSSSGLLPGTYNLWILNGDHALADEDLEVVLEPGVDVNDVRVELAGVGTITGIVRDAQGHIVAGVHLGVSSTERPSNASGISADDGRYIIEQVPPGHVRVMARDGHALLRAPGTSDDDEQGTPAHVASGETTEVDIVIESRRAVIRGRVLDEQGSPVADAFVSHQREPDSVKTGKGWTKGQLRWRFDDQPVLTDTDGRFVIEGLAQGASYAVGAFRKGGGEIVEDGVHPGDEVELTIVATGEIAGTVVVSKAGAAPDRFELTLTNAAEGLSRTDEPFRSGGKFRIKQLPPGTYVLIVDSPAGAARIEGIELGAGEVKDDLIVRLSPRVTVRGRVIDLDTREPVSGITITIAARGASMSYGPDKPSDLPRTSDVNGRFEVANALSGKVSLMLEPRFGDDAPYNWQYKPVQIPAGDGVVDIGDLEVIARRIPSGQAPGDVGFKLKERDLGSEADAEALVLTVALVRPGGPAEAGGLTVGDQIETVGGHDVTGINSFRFGPLIRVAPGDSFELGLAGGKTVTITTGPPIK